MLRVLNSFYFLILLQDAGITGAPIGAWEVLLPPLVETYDEPTDRQTDLVHLCTGCPISIQSLSIHPECLTSKNI